MEPSLACESKKGSPGHPQLKREILTDRKSSAMRVNFAPWTYFPDLVFGLVGPIGVDLDYIQTAISDALRSFNYDTETLRITEIMRDLNSSVQIDDSNALT